ncbi:MAG: BrnA antitoxin family protein [Candidatus Binataceae bacterium]
MKREYDLSKGRRGPVLPLAPGKVRITIRLDRDIVDEFREQVRTAHGGNYQTLINDALREHLRRPTLAEAVGAEVRTVLRKELRKCARCFAKSCGRRAAGR